VAVVVFSGPVQTMTLRVVDLGSGQSPRVVVEMRQPPDAMGGTGWAQMDPIPRATLEALLIASHVISP
jgi:hypothetical protein